MVSSPNAFVKSWSLRQHDCANPADKVNQQLLFTLNPARFANLWRHSAEFASTMSSLPFERTWSNRIDSALTASSQQLASGLPDLLSVRDSFLLHYDLYTLCFFSMLPTLFPSAAEALYTLCIVRTFRDTYGEVSFTTLDHRSPAG